MTNKMPVVGQRYREIDCDDEGILTITKIMVHYKNKYSDDNFINLRLFWNEYEELPTSNSQKTEEVQIKKNIVADEVGRALEELKKEIKKPAFSKKVGDIDYCGMFFTIAGAAQNLVNSLEAEKANIKLEAEEPVDIKIEEKANTHQLNTPVKFFTNPAYINDFWKKKFLGNKPVETQKKNEIEDCLTYGQAFSHTSIDAEGNIRKENIPFRDIYKEEEPQSIWKDVSELPFRHASTLSVKEELEYKVIGKNTIIYKEKSLEFIKIGDLVNSIEQMKKDIEELKRK